jgi:hypothetical protein
MKRATIRAVVLALPTGEGAQQPSGKKRGVERLWQPVRHVP